MPARAGWPPLARRRGRRRGAPPHPAARRPFPEGAGRLDRAEFVAVAKRALQVVADDLLDLGHPLGEPLDEPPREALVQLRPELLGDAAVGHLLDEDVPEAERLLTARAPARPDELLADERLEHGGRPTPAPPPGVGRRRPAAGTPCRRRTRARARRARRGRAGRAARLGAPRSSAGSAARRRPPRSPWHGPGSCSRKSGFPSAAAMIRSRAPGGSAVPRSRLSKRRSDSSGKSGSSEREVAFRIPPAHRGRNSSSSGRARQT